MFIFVIAVFTLYLKYTSVHLCIRVNIMTFIEQQQMTAGVFCICIFVQYGFIFQVSRFRYWIWYLKFFVGALGQTSRISLWVNTGCTEENIFKFMVHSYFLICFCSFFFTKVEIQFRMASSLLGWHIGNHHCHNSQENYETKDANWC